MSTHNICRGDSNEYPQHMFLWRNKQNYPLIITKYPHLFHCGMGCMGRKLFSFVILFYMGEWKLTNVKHTMNFGQSPNKVFTAINHARALNVEVDGNFETHSIFLFGYMYKVPQFNVTCPLLNMQVLVKLREYLITSFMHKACRVVIKQKTNAPWAHGATTPLA